MSQYAFWYMLSTRLVRMGGGVTQVCKGDPAAPRGAGSLLTCLPQGLGEGALKFHLGGQKEGQPAATAGSLGL